jgi:hypothetical protein
MDFFETPEMLAVYAEFTENSAKVCDLENQHKTKRK